MSIGILYESDEWSNNRLRDCLDQRGAETEMIYTEDPVVDLNGPFPHSLYVNRVFPSAEMRGNVISIEKLHHLLNHFNKCGIQVVNSYEAFLYDCSKWKTYSVLKDKGFTLPETVYFDGESGLNIEENALEYPLVAKRDCGGRSFDMQIISMPDDMIDFKRNMSRTHWVFQAFIEPVKGYTTRVEVVGGKIMTALKRFIGKRGISSYSAGSGYEVYEDCPSEILDDSIAALNALHIEMGSLDFIEDGRGRTFLIDVNATSNFTPDYIPLLGFDPIEKMAEYVIKKYSV